MSQQNKPVMLGRIADDRDNYFLGPHQFLDWGNDQIRCLRFCSSCKGGFFLGIYFRVFLLAGCWGCGKVVESEQLMRMRT